MLAAVAVALVWGQIEMRRATNRPFERRAQIDLPIEIWMGLAARASPEMARAQGQQVVDGHVAGDEGQSASQLEPPLA